MLGCMTDRLVYLLLYGLLIPFVQPQCSRCHSTQHFTVSCPSKTSTALREDTALVMSFQISGNEEEPEYQKVFLKKVMKSWNL